MKRNEMRASLHWLDSGFLRSRIGATLALAMVLAMLLASSVIAEVQAAPGGVSAREGSSPVASEEAEPPVAGSAALVGDRAVAPTEAPEVVKAVIAAANRIRMTPYVWGGGHKRWWDRGYDCSGSTSYALRGGGLLKAPLTSGSFASWGEPGAGEWITIYANRKHVYAVIAGLRWDTAGNPKGVTGPRWHAEPPYPKGFVVRHPEGY